MKYEPLSKLFYKRPDAFEEIYKDRFEDADTIHLNFSIGDHPAFIVPTSELWGLIVKIQSLNTKVSYYRWSDALPLAALRQFTIKCLVDEIVLTNDIEGVNSTRREIHAALEKVAQQDSKALRRFGGLVQKYSRLQENDIVPLSSCKDIRALYNELVLPEVLEEDKNDAPDGKLFRKDSVSVTNSVQKEIHQGVYPESKIILTMEQALSFLHNTEINPFIKISAFHYLFGYIHPFYNGNGRLSRFISSYLLSKELDPLIGYRLSYTIKENIKKYYDAFKICNDIRSKGDITPFVIQFLEMIAEAMEQLNEALQKRSHALRHYRSMIQSNDFLSSDDYHALTDLLLQVTLFSYDGISIKDMLSYTPFGESTLRKRLAKLKEYGILEIWKEGNQKHYQLHLKQLEALSKQT